MTHNPHVETHFRASDTIRDIVIGMSDGLTVPFALAAGLSGAVASSHIITTAGIAEIAAGSVAMGLGGYLAARGDAEHYAHELQRERQEIQTIPEQEAAEIVEVFEAYGVSAEQCAPVVAALRTDREAWVRFMMRFELGMEQPESGRATRSAATIAGAYVAGGLIPIAPYFLTPGVGEALPYSVAVTLIALALFGFIKGNFSGTPRLRSALQTLLIGGTAAAAAFVLAKTVS
ncbi:MAG: VIT1/CCC1 transporter family protein [Betaproteobacteria bacterium]|nr:VIT1/CCC1 transporter family protein [Betaproteobacteria bacterium]